MKILITSASGLIGSSICARLVDEGHSVVAVTRPGGIAPFGVTETVSLDVSATVDNSDRTALLEGVDAVVNCAASGKPPRARSRCSCAGPRGAVPGL